MVVDEDTTVCIIEVMKLFSTIKAEKRGRIARVCVDDGELVEYRQVLFMLDPDAG
jgi:acetyl-CoA carboxylase biotin carboxyl carrier protein